MDEEAKNQSQGRPDCLVSESLAQRRELPERTGCKLMTLETVTPADLVSELRRFIDASVERAGETHARKPGHRESFHWPPHPVSPRYHVLASDWTGRAEFQAEGETFSVSVATTPHGVFGRCDALWCEGKGTTVETMLLNLARVAEPLFARQRTISNCLEHTGRFTGHIRGLPFADLLKLLYCPDRDVANEARIEIETHASLGVFAPALTEVLRDNRHPCRRSAQWCVLDLFEDLPSICHTAEEREAAVDAIKNLIWTATDDFARTTFKAGVVLGGHVPSEIGGPVLLDCLAAPSKYGRRSAIHGLFHVVEWDPDQQASVVSALRARAAVEPEPLLVSFALQMANDIESGDADHVTEPLFEDEA